MSTAALRVNNVNRDVILLQVPAVLIGLVDSNGNSAKVESSPFT